ncbi:MAG: methyltransferase domain-containing protein [Clostridia bacterium]|nr:methyltransferase domain-containing protein [Clostridia bacterium]
MDFCCPICRLPLIEEEGRIKKCAVGHSFDRAKAGYYNLLIGQGSGTHGDNREMVEARRDFLTRGHYLPLAEHISRLISIHLAPEGSLIDLGAGEGYYTDLVERTVFDRDGSSNVLALDISKDAIKHLAKRNQRISTAVASSYDIPVADASVDLALLVFSPLALSEIRRILRPRAKFIMVFPDEMHLFGLKSAIYKTPYKNKPEPTDIEGFTLLTDDKLSYEITLRGREEIESLFMMTPYAYRTSKEDKERLYSNDVITTEVAFRILVYQKS